MKIELEREEIMACILALDKIKPYAWRNSALRRLEKFLDLKNNPIQNCDLCSQEMQSLCRQYPSSYSCK